MSVDRIFRPIIVCALLLAVSGCGMFYDSYPNRRSGDNPRRAAAPGEFVPYPGVEVKRIPVPAGGRHTVVRGNTIYAISRLYGVPVRSIIETNHLRPPYTLSVGDKLVVKAPRLHKVVKGDTVYSLSRRYNVPMNELTRANGIAPPFRIALGQDLTIPASIGGATVAGTPAAAAPKAATAKQIAALPRAPKRAGKGFRWPLSGKIITGFGQQRGGSHNDGINIAASRGARVHAAENGVVAYAGNELRGFGNLLLIKHAGGFMTAYAHNDRLLVARGQKVKQGQEIARVGSTGSVATPQLHFEIRKGRKAIDPIRYLPKRTASR